MTKPKYVLTVPWKGAGKQITAISVNTDSELAKRLEQARRAGGLASFKRLK